MNRVLIDASNLHTGGGVQVAATFLNDLFRLDVDSQPSWAASMDLEVSSEVMSNLHSMAKEHASLKNVNANIDFLIPQRGRRPYGVAFHVFGPTYGRRKADVEITGFADPRLPLGLDGLSAAEKVRRWLKKRRIRSFDQIIVETESFARQVVTLGVPRSRIHVVPNTFAPEFMCPQAENESLFERPSDADLVLAYPARPYPHKNHEFLGAVHCSLLSIGIDIRFAITLTREELAMFDAETQRACIPVGVITLDQCVSLYQQADGVFFPSLLEVFSATPLEALASKKLLFASDRDFVSGIVPPSCAKFFDPHDADSAAAAVAQVMRDPHLQQSMKSAGHAFASAWPSARERTLSYINLIGRML